MELYRHAIRYAPNVGCYLANYGYLLSGKQAIDVLSKAVAECPGSHVAALNLAVLLEVHCGVCLLIR